MTALTAYDLRTEHRDTPLGIDVAEPRFSWRLRSAESHLGQAAYRIVVTADRADDPTWDSGWVDSAAGLDVVCGGQLGGRTRYDWSLQLRDSSGQETAAGSSWFETALLDRDFAGAFIAIDRTFDLPGNDMDPPEDDDIPRSVRHILPTPHLRREFTATGAVVRARVYATAHGLYTLHLNGHRVGDAELLPGWTDYTERLQYQTHDVTDLVKTGANAIGLVLADGWWAGYVGFDARRQGNHYGTAAEGWAQLEIEYEDGSVDRVVTDEDWRWAPGPIEYTDLLMGERIDARLDLGDWSSPGFDASSWGPVVPRTDDFTTFLAQVDEPIKVVEVVPAATVDARPDGAALYDFGQNLVGRVRIDLGPLPAGTVVVLRHGETLENGALYTANLRSAEQRDVYVARDGANVFEPVFTLHGFRYLEVAGLDQVVPVENVTAQVLTSATPAAGSIETSSADVNQLISNIRWGQQGNFVGLPTDCPQRDERLGWMADAQVFLPTAALNADVQSFFARWLADVRGAQSAEGSFTDVVPVVSTFFADGAPAWADAGVLIPWHLYRVYGDRRLLADSIDSMRRWVDFVERHNPSLVWTKRVGMQFGDWLQIDAETPRALLATAYFARSAATVALACGALGLTEEAAHYADLADRIAAAFRDAFGQPDGTLTGDTQTGYLLALGFDLVSGEQRDQAAAHLVQAIDRHDGLLTTGFVGVSLLCPVLSEIGRDDLAFALLETDRYPSWLYSVRQGATTIWERWDGWTEHQGFQSVEMNSFNHYSLGSVGEWLYRYLAGIDQQPDSVAYERLRIAPRIGGSLTSATASYESPRGRIATSWTLVEDTITLTVEIPPGSTATVELPGREPEQVGSGRHEFTSTATGRTTPVSVSG